MSASASAVRVVGNSGQPVVLLPGGAESSEGFFPGLVEGLVADPGCRVVHYDRPGTGTSTVDGSLAGAADAVRAVVDELGLGPVVVVGQSLGGAVAALLAREHPDVVAGLVLLDPTPVNDPAICAQTARTTRLLEKATSTPVLGRAVTGALRATLARQRRGLRPDCAAAHARISELDIPKLARAVDDLTDVSAGFRETDLRHVPTVLVTADRAPGDAVHRAHGRLADALGGTLVSWPRATHDVHLSHPDETLAAVRGLVGRALGKRPAPRTDVRVVGESGPPVMLLPGGAEECDGFFPGLVEGLVADPGCRVILHDRPGTGSATETGFLVDAPAHLAALVAELDMGPVVVVGQSLGGGVATLLARDHPDVVAGLVLLDPTPVNDAAGCARLERTMRLMDRLCAVPALQRLLSGALRASFARQRRTLALRPDCEAAHRRIGDLDVRNLARAVRGITEVSAGFRESDLPRDIPSVVVTADRRPSNSIRRSHARVADALGAPLVSWPGAVHNVQLDHPDETLETVRDLVRRAAHRTA